MDFDFGFNLYRPENTHEIKMWTIPSLTERHLRDLMVKLPEFMKDVTIKHLIPFFSNENDGIELDNASIIVLGPNNQRWKIISGHGKHEISIELMDINDPVPIIKPDDKNTEEIHCKELNKTFLGKCIIQQCGNEGTSKKESMRKLLQFALDRLHTGEYDTKVLKNATVTIYDKMEKMILVSGEGRNKFVINLENGNPKFNCLELEKKKKSSKNKLFICVILVFIGFTLMIDMESTCSLRFLFRTLQRIYVSEDIEMEEPPIN